MEQAKLIYVDNNPEKISFFKKLFHEFDTLQASSEEEAIEILGNNLAVRTVVYDQQIPCSKTLKKLIHIRNIQQRNIRFILSEWNEGRFYFYLDKESIQKQLEKTKAKKKQK